MNETARWIAAYPDLDTARRAVEIVDRVGDADARLLGDRAAFNLLSTAHRRRVPRLRPYRFSVVVPLGAGLGAALGALVGVSVEVLVAPGTGAGTVGAIVGAGFGLAVACSVCVLDRIGERHASDLTGAETASASEVSAVWIGVRTRNTVRDAALEVLEDTRPLHLSEILPDDSVA